MSMRGACQPREFWSESNSRQQKHETSLRTFPRSGCRAFQALVRLGSKVKCARASFGANPIRANKNTKRPCGRFRARTLDL